MQSKEAPGAADSVALWLHNKLHSPTHLWSFSSTVVSQYTLEKLQTIRDCFSSLDSLVKIKFFLTLFHIPKRNYEEFKPVVQEIIDNTLQTSLDQWVLSIATFIQPFWNTQTMSTDLTHDQESFREAYNDLTRALKECVASDEGCERVKFLLPIEFGYLNKSVLQSLLPSNHSQQSSLMALTSTASSSTVVNEILVNLLGGESSTMTEFNPNDSIENGSGVDRAKRHFNLIKATKSMSLDDLKFKASHYSKSKTTKQLLSGHTNQLGMGVYGEGGDPQSLSPTPTNGGLNPQVGGKTVPYVGRFLPSKKMESMTAFNSSSLSSPDASSPYGSKLFSSSMNNTGSSSFFKRSITSAMTSSTTITGKSSIKRDFGIKLLDVQEQSASPKEAKRKRKEQEKETLKKLKQEAKQVEKQNKEKAAAAAAIAASELAENTEQTVKPDAEASDHKPAEMESTSDPVKPANDFELGRFTTNTNEPTAAVVPPPQISSISQTTGLVPNLLHGSLSDPPPAPVQTKVFQPPMQMNQLIGGNQQQQASTYQAPQMMRLNDFFTTASSQQQAQQQQPSSFIPPLPQQSLQQQHQQAFNQPVNQHHHHHPPLHINQILQQQQQYQQYQQQQHMISNNQFNQQQYSNNVPQPQQAPQPPSFHNLKIEGAPSTNGNNGLGMNINQPPPNSGGVQMSSTPSSSSASANRQQPSLTLTREQMLQAQEMFNNSNKLTRPEKALILGFIAGSRENPRPEHGPVISIKLNEAEEILTMQNGQQHLVIGELYFQMNYETGEYKKIKKFKPLNPANTAN